MSPISMKPILALSIVLVFALSANLSYAANRADTVSVLVAGDAMITLPWSDITDPEFTALIDEVRSADVAVVNLEMLIHTYQGYPQAQSGGTWVAAEPRIAHELAWAGIDMVGLANNHTYDYGAIGLIETMENLAAAGVRYAGVGMDLQEARRPTYFHGPKGTAALLATASSFIPFGKAGRSRPDLHGRPGLNPLTIRADKRRWMRIRRLVDRMTARLGWGADLRHTATYHHIDGQDLAANLAAVQEAENNAEVVIMSMHSHEMVPGSRYAVPQFLQEVAHRCVDLGVDVFFAHGPHTMRGIEIYKGRPIFYGLGNFVFQPDTIQKLPAEFYAMFALGDNATLEDVYAARARHSIFDADPIYWESVAAKVIFHQGRLRRIELIPLSLGHGEPVGVHGRPEVADPEHGMKIIEKLASLSRPFDTDIRHEGRIGVISLKGTADADVQNFRKKECAK